MRELPDLRHPALAARGRHPVLAVYDGSAASKHALAYAAGLARRTGRWLVIARIWWFGARQAERMRRLRAELADTDLGGLDIEILPDDMLSGGSLSVLTGVILSLPLAGTHAAILIFGGSFPGHVIIPRDYWLHILVLPVALGALLLLSHRSGRPRVFRVRPRVFRVRRVDPLLPFTAAVLVALGAAAQINPVWLYGPYQPGSISAGSVPDWYMGFLDGALRVMPAWELSFGGHPLPLDVLIPAVIVPGLFFTLVAAYPLLDGWIAGACRRTGCCRPSPPIQRTGSPSVSPGSRCTGCCGRRPRTTRSPTTSSSRCTR